MSTKEDNDPLEGLVVDRDRASKEHVAEALGGVIDIGDDGDLLKAPGFDPLNSKQRMIALLLGQWAACQLDLADERMLSLEYLSDQLCLALPTIDTYVSDVSELVVSEGEALTVANGRIVDAAEFVDPEVTASE
ncbi:hypothetical protein [Halobaculum sp. MBLA0143]|uniref:hypothetical protein n=1 Tax=Halobaculum sp. MBLA0143 TaxID=3079933 RepID=UPI003524F979